MQELDATRPGPPTTPTRRWIEALHVDLVGHPPDRQALARWTTAARRGAGHREIAGGVLTSSEYCGAQIAALYRSLLDRPADPPGLGAWTTVLGSGVALQDIIAALCDSSEYKTNHPDAAALVESLYRRLLSRASDPEGKAAWLAALDNRSSTLSVIRGFLSSTEYCAQRITELFDRLLGREPQPGELSERVIALSQGTPLQQVVLDFVSSAEYIARAASGPLRRPVEADADALALVASGDVAAALARLMQRHGPAVYRYCRVALNDAALADDIHQQVFIEAFRDLPRFARRSTVRTWLLGIARHRVLDAAKRRRRARARIDAGASLELPDPESPAADRLDDAQLRAALAVCIAQLDEPIRTTVLLRYQQGLTYEEMAAMSGEKPGTLQARVARALRRLRALIEDHVGGSA